MKLIFVADIFGVTESFKMLCQQVMIDIPQKFNAQCHLIGPYNAQPHAFKSETDAYQYFIENVTHAGYAEKLEAELLTISGAKLLICFSVGGSAVWQICAEKNIENCLGAVCFYSSQIRHMTTLTPKLPIKLIFPATEPHFSVQKLRSDLTGKLNVTIEQSEYLHGFMNQESHNFEQSAYQHYIKKLTELVPVAKSLNINDK